MVRKWMRAIAGTYKPKCYTIGSPAALDPVRMQSCCVDSTNFVVPGVITALGLFFLVSVIYMCLPGFLHLHLKFPDIYKQTDVGGQEII